MATEADLRDRIANCAKMAAKLNGRRCANRK